MSSTNDQFSERGFLLLPEVVSPETCAFLLAAINGTRPRSDALAPNRRNLLRETPATAEFARAGALMDLARQRLGPAAFPVRALFFDKTPDANWSVTWHQDVTVAVRVRRDAPGFSGWSIKDEVPHVQPPVSVLENMLTIRLHLDDCDESNGALQVLPGSHASGRLDVQQIAHWRKTVEPVTCAVGRGGVLLMRPLLLHASGKARDPRHRRVVHIEYAAADLPGGLEWYERAAA